MGNLFPERGKSTLAENEVPFHGIQTADSEAEAPQIPG